jgi:DNA-binding NarL/FixJ family response regulator
VAEDDGRACVLAVVLSREHEDFTDAERDLLNRARPFLIQAYRNAAAYTLAKPPDPRATLEAHGLTTRQAEVLGLVALGGSNRDVAARLGLSDRTVQKHLENAFRALGVTTRSEAAARVWQLSGQPGPFAGEVVVNPAA